MFEQRHAQFFALLGRASCAFWFVKRHGPRNYACGGGSAEGGSWPGAASLGPSDQGVVMGLLCGRSDRYGGSSITPLSSRTIVLLASRSSRRILPAVRITSGRRSGGITIRATINNSNISAMLKNPHLHTSRVQ